MTFRKMYHRIWKAYFTWCEVGKVHNLAFLQSGVEMCVALSTIKRGGAGCGRLADLRDRSGMPGLSSLLVASGEVATLTTAPLTRMRAAAS